MRKNPPTQCIASGCDRMARTVNLCNRHYLRRWKHGSTDLMPRGGMDLQARFWSKVNKTAGCWTWLGARNNADYGLFRYDGKCQLAHRVSFILAGNTVPDDLELDHLCRNRACVNPAHLEAVTRRVNILRSACPIALNAAANVCPNGHPYTADNLLVNGRHGGRYRQCRECAAARRQRDSAKRRRKAS